MEEKEYKDFIEDESQQIEVNESETIVEETVDFNNEPIQSDEEIFVEDSDGQLSFDEQQPTVEQMEVEEPTLLQQLDEETVTAFEEETSTLEVSESEDVIEEESPELPAEESNEEVLTTEVCQEAEASQPVEEENEFEQDVYQDKQDDTIENDVVIPVIMETNSNQESNIEEAEATKQYEIKPEEVIEESKEEKVVSKKKKKSFMDSFMAGYDEDDEELEEEEQQDSNTPVVAPVKKKSGNKKASNTTTKNGVKKVRRKKRLGFNWFFWISFIVIAIPVGYFLYLLYLASQESNVPIVGNRINNDIVYTIEESQISEVDSLIKEIAGVDSFESTLKVETYRLYIDADDELVGEQLEEIAVKAYESVNSVLSVEKYFTSSEELKNYDLEIVVYNDIKSETGEVICLLKNANMETYTIQNLTTAVDQEVADKLREEAKQPEEADNNEVEEFPDTDLGLDEEE